MKLKTIKLKEYIESSNTGLDAITRAPIVREDTGIKCIRIGDISQKKGYKEFGFTKVSKENYEKFKLTSGDILIARTGSTIGVNKYISENIKCVYNNGIIRLKVNKLKNNSLFVYYLINNKYFKNYINSISAGTSTQPNVQIDDLLNYEVPLLEKNMQDRFVNLLEKFDEKIELNNQINTDLYNMGDILYSKYFNGDYEDVMVYYLKDVAENFDSKRKPMSSREREKHKGIYPYYGATSIIDYVDDYIFDGTYLLMGEDGTVTTDDGKPVLQYIWDKNWINNHTHVLKGTKITTEHLLFALRNTKVDALVTGAVQPKINQENMNKIKITLRNKETNKKFEDIIEKIILKSKQIQEQNQTLEQLRDILLPKLMNGEIDLDKIDI